MAAGYFSTPLPSDKQETLSPGQACQIPLYLPPPAGGPCGYKAREGQGTSGESIPPKGSFFLGAAQDPPPDQGFLRA